MSKRKSDNELEVKSPKRAKTDTKDATTDTPKKEKKQKAPIQVHDSEQVVARVKELGAKFSKERVGFFCSDTSVLLKCLNKIIPDKATKNLGTIILEMVDVEKWVLANARSKDFRGDFDKKEGFEYKLRSNPELLKSKVEKTTRPKKIRSIVEPNKYMSCDEHDRFGRLCRSIKPRSEDGSVEIMWYTRRGKSCVREYEDDEYDGVDDDWETRDRLVVKFKMAGREYVLVQSDWDIRRPASDAVLAFSPNPKTIQNDTVQMTRLSFFAFACASYNINVAPPEFRVHHGIELVPGITRIGELTNCWLEDEEIEQYNYCRPSCYRDVLFCMGCVTEPVAGFEKVFAKKWF